MEFKISGRETLPDPHSYLGLCGVACMLKCIKWVACIDHVNHPTGPREVQASVILYRKLGIKHLLLLKTPELKMKVLIHPGSCPEAARNAG